MMPAQRAAGTLGLDVLFTCYSISWSGKSLATQLVLFLAFETVCCTAKLFQLALHSCNQALSLLV